MKTGVEFFIEDKSFVLSKEAIGAHQFTVKSMPRPYPVALNEDLEPFQCAQILMSQNQHNLMLVDEKVFNLYKKDFQFDEKRVFQAPATEEFKTFTGVLAVLDFLNDHGFTKAEKLIVIGGGIIEDIGGFVGACYRRGIRWVYFPTTLLAMSDSCIGGKTGINYHQAKNQIALFSAPAEVIINPSFLHTLAPADIQSGLGEILKLMVIGGNTMIDVYQRYVKNGLVDNFSDYSTLLFSALAVKKAVIEEDEFEVRYRKALNYGHTLGHAIESLSGYQIAHGQAVVIGMILANELSARRNILNEREKKQVNQLCFDLLDERVMRIMRELDITQLLSYLRRDKKTEGTALNFILLTAVGKLQLMKLELDAVLQDEIAVIMEGAFKN